MILNGWVKVGDGSGDATLSGVADMIDLATGP